MRQNFDQFRAREQVRERQEAAASTLRRFRPRKTDRLRYVTIGLDGKRLPKGSRRKGFLVYVGKDGKKSFGDGRQKRYGKPLYQTDFRVRQAKRKTAKKFFFGKKSKVNVKRGKGFMRLLPKTFKGKPLKLDLLASGMASMLKKAVGSNKVRSGWQFDLSTKFGKGKMSVSFDISAVFVDDIGTGVIPAKLFKSWAFSVLWRQLADELTQRELVSSGSNSHIAVLKSNRGKKRKDWKRTDGTYWGKADFFMVDFREATVELTKLDITE